jgi:hypothetical protein
MNLEEIRLLKSLPKGKEIISFTDRAKFEVERYVVKVTAEEKKVYEYKGHISFVYANGKTYDKYFRGKGFRKILNTTIEYFEFRNRQMIGYEK